MCSCRMSGSPTDPAAATDAAQTPSKPPPKGKGTLGCEIKWMGSAWWTWIRVNSTRAFLNANDMFKNPLLLTLIPPGVRGPGYFQQLWLIGLGEPREKQTQKHKNTHTKKEKGLCSGPVFAIQALVTGGIVWGVQTISSLKIDIQATSSMTTYHTLRLESVQNVDLDFSRSVLHPWKVTVESKVDLYMMCHFQVDKCCESPGHYQLGEGTLQLYNTLYI